MIAVIDYGMGNLRSVVNAFRSIGEETVLASDASVLSRASGIVLPGVGAFAEAMHRLKAGGFVQALEHEVRQDGKPFLGLCLGMQLMASESLEHGRHAGLGWIEGRVVPIAADAGVRVPHMGWNDLEVVRRDGLLAQVSAKPTFYFVHSFVVEPSDPSVVSGYAMHGARFAAVLERDNLQGTQFHPEKSQRDGIALLRSYVDRVKATC